MMLLGVAALVFVVIVTVIAGLWWVWTSGERVRRRLARHVEDAAPERLLLRTASRYGSGWLERATSSVS